MGWNDNLSDPDSYADYYPHLAFPRPRFERERDEDAGEEE